MESPISLSFGNFPEDVQLCVLSFLGPSDLAVFASTCKRFVSLYRHDQRLWFSMCDRRWGGKTLIGKWGGGKISYNIINDRETGRSRGFGFVTFKDEKAMRDAIEGMNSQDLDARNITINEAQSRGSAGGGGGGGGFRGPRRDGE